MATTLAAIAPVSAETGFAEAAWTKALWCGSAFTWLARDADDAGDGEGAVLFDAWALRFTGLAATAMQDAGLARGDIDVRIAESDLAVLEEMKSGALSHPIESCPDLAGTAEDGSAPEG